MLYVRKKLGLADRSALMNEIRNFLTDTRLGWVESQYSQNSTDEILIQTGGTDSQNQKGILHIIVTAQTGYDDIEFHAYREDHPAFQNPNSFDAPDTSYLPGGTNYDSTLDFYNPAYPAKIMAAYPCDIILAGNEKIIYISISSTKEWIAGMFGLMECEGGESFAWKHMVDRGTTNKAIYWDGSIQKGDVINFICTQRVNSFYSGSPYFLTRDYPVLSKTPQRYISKAWGIIVYNNTAKVFDFEDLYIAGKNLAFGDECVIENERYLVLCSYSNGTYMVKIGQEI